MQPYLFPYIGYFQLLRAVDDFVFYDDVQYINDGWINRNRTPAGWFTVPVASQSLQTSIGDTRIAEVPYARFRRKWLRRFTLNYGGAPYYSAAEGLVRSVFTEDEPSISQMAARSVELTAGYLEIERSFHRASRVKYDRKLSGQERLLGLLEACRADQYVNPYGGRHLYEASVFAEHQVSLRFLSSTLDYTEERPGFGYSILHLLAHHSPAQVREWMGCYTLTTNNHHAPPNDRPKEGNSVR